MIGLWLIFLPVAAALSVVTVYLKQEYEGCELWQEGMMAERAPLSLLTLFIVVAALAGLPPFIGYSSKQLLFPLREVPQPVRRGRAVPIYGAHADDRAALPRVARAQPAGRRSTNSIFAGESTVAFPAYPAYAALRGFVRRAWVCL